MKNNNNEILRRNKNAKRGQNKGTTVALYRGISLNKNDIMPDTLVRTFNYTSELTYLTSANPWYCKVYRLNSPHDPDPELLTTSCAGWTSISPFYNAYRVTNVHVKWSCAANRANPTIIGVFCAPTDESANVGSIHLALDALENNYSTGPMLNAIYASTPTSVEFDVNLAQLSGNRRNYLSDSDYAAAPNANPGKMLFIHLVCIDTFGDSLTEGIGSCFTLQFQTTFFQRKQMYD